FGTLRAGCVVVNVNPLYTARELEHQLNDAGAEAIVILENFASVLEQVRSRTPLKHVVITSLGEMLGLKGLIVNLVVRRGKKRVRDCAVVREEMHERAAEVWVATDSVNAVRDTVTAEVGT